jgi:hypothetical protein
MIANKKEVTYVIANKKTVRSIWRNKKLLYYYGGPDKITTPWKIGYTDNQGLTVWKQELVPGGSWEGAVSSGILGMTFFFDRTVPKPTIFEYGGLVRLYSSSDKTTELFNAIYLSDGNLFIGEGLGYSRHFTPDLVPGGFYVCIYKTAPTSSNKVYVDLIFMKRDKSGIDHTESFSFEDDKLLKYPFSTYVTSSVEAGMDSLALSAERLTSSTKKTKLIFGNTGDINSGDYYVYGTSFTPEGTSISDVSITTSAHHASALYNKNTNSINCMIYSTTSGPVDASVTYYSLS